MRYVIDQPTVVMRFVTQMVAHIRGEIGGAYTAIGIANDDNELVAGLVFQHWPLSELVEITGAALPGHQWLTRETLRIMYGYPFEQCNCQTVVMRTLASDEHLLRQLVAVGHELVRLPRAFGRDRDGCYCYLTKEAWLNNKIFKRIYNKQLLEKSSKAA
jgi:hypothetical protein